MKKYCKDCREKPAAPEDGLCLDCWVERFNKAIGRARLKVGGGFK